jgi:KaiC/GvpD/RAD55 family RecA-like ATPase
MDYLYALNQLFAARGVTVMLILEVAHSGGYWHGEMSKQVSYMSDNVLLLSMELAGTLKRTVRILKSRGSAHDGQLCELEINRSGVLVHAPDP